MKPMIVGWGHTKFGKLSEQNLEDLILAAAGEAIAHAGIAASDVDAIWLGHFNAGMVTDAFASSLVLGLDEGLRFKPATRCENACASGSAAIYAALEAVRSGSVKVALVVGVEKMTHLDTATVSAALGGAAYQKEESGQSFAQIFGQIAGKYFQRFGDKSETLAQIAAKNHGNAMDNPLAQMRKAVTVEFCNTVSERNPLIAAPLRMTDCSLITDGAAALVIVAEDVAQDMARAVGFRATVQVNDLLPMSRRDMTELAGVARAFDRAYEAAGVGVNDLDFAEVHDCFTIAELMIYEAMGLARKVRATVWSARAG